MSAASHITPSPSSAKAGGLPVAAFTDRLIRQSAAQVDDRILIIGPCDAEVLLDLYRRGFHQVCHETGERLPAHDTFDIVWLLRRDTVQSLNLILTKLGRALRQGGTLVVHTRHPAASDVGVPRVREVRRQLAVCGFLPLIQVSDGEAGYLLSAHRPSVAAMPLSATA